MIRTYLTPIMVALGTFIVLAFLGTVPWAIYQYRKHGYLNFWRNFMIFSFIFYGLTAFFLVSLPFPETRHNAPLLQGTGVQLNPLHFLQTFQQVPGFDWRASNTYPLLIKSFTFLEVFFNVLLLVPLGVYIRYFVKKISRWYWALLGGFGTSLFFEVSQITAFFGYFDHPYRYFDTVDLVMNTTGTLFGFFVAPLFLFFIPNREELQVHDEKYRPNQLASYGAQLIDVWLSLSVASFLAHLPFHTGLVAIDRLLWGFLLVVIMPLFFKGRTLGGLVVRIRLQPADQAKTFILPLFLRYLLIFLPGAFVEFTQLINTKQTMNKSLVVIQVTLSIVVFLMYAMITIDILRKWLKNYPEPYFNQYPKVEAVRYAKKKKSKN